VGGGAGMNTRKLVLPIRKHFSLLRKHFPSALVAIAVGFLVAGWLFLQRGTPTAPELRNQGYIGFYISDPEARVDVSVSPSSGPGGEVLPGYRWLSISMLVRSREGPVWWAVALGEDARFPPGDPVSGTMPGVEAPGEPTYFVNDVEWPTRADPDDEHGTGTVIFGKQPEGGYFQISFLTVKVAEPLVQGIGKYVTLSTPTLGRNDYDQPPQIGGQIEGSAGQTEERANPRQFYNGKADAKLRRVLSELTWYVPKRLDVGFDAELTRGHELVGVRQEDSGTPLSRRSAKCGGPRIP
jgi:hypothetical protein